MPRHQRRKEDRPDEIVNAAFEEFSEKGYAETRLQDVAKRAQVSKGLPYLYFKTKEELFKAVIKAFIKPRVAALMDVARHDQLTVVAFLEQHFLPFAVEFVHSRKARVMRLMIAEGPRHPDLLEFYAQQVLHPAIDTLRGYFSRAAQRGEIKTAGLEQFPQLLIAPVLLGAIWNQLFHPYVALNTDAMLRRHVQNLITVMSP